ncbi:hypothetical protein EV44_g3683 [Erysiphe necator]|uniref:Uncharacterized protein n=1 Tax=Uncinula necator TaxID=52586 RepID=A0A0B1P1Y6_UNCNE|nr:hypothetical protein EV44_g3683 [Erysiphe necator]
MNIDTASELDLESEIESESEIDEFPPLPSNPSLKRTSEALSPTQGSDYTKDTFKDNHRSQNSTLMTKARGLLNLVGPFLEEMETDCPGAGAGFLALISEGVSRAIRGETIFLRTTTDTEIMPNSSANKKNSWAARVANGQTSIVNNPTPKPRTKPTPPQGQSHEDRRVMIRLEHDHEARKTEPFLLRQQIQRILPDPSLVADTMQVPSGIAILAPTPAKAAAILQYKDVIAQRFGKAIVERQESWTTFIIGPLPKQVTTMDGTEDPLDGLLLQEPGLISIRDEVQIKKIAWTKKSQESSDLLGHIRIHIPETKAHKFPSRLQLFGFAVGIQRIRDRKPIPTCEKCHGFHSTRTCARQPMCKLCGTEYHEGSCAHPIRCLNCRGPHESTSIFCPARPRRKNGAIVRFSGAQLRHIRIAGRKDFNLAHYCEITPESTPESTPNETGVTESNFTAC